MLSCQYGQKSQRNVSNIAESMQQGIKAALKAKKGLTKTVFNKVSGEFICCGCLPAFKQSSQQDAFVLSCKSTVMCFSLAH